MTNIWMKYLELNYFFYSDHQRFIILDKSPNEIARKTRPDGEESGVSPLWKVEKSSLPPLCKVGTRPSGVFRLVG